MHPTLHNWKFGDTIDPCIHALQRRARTAKRQQLATSLSVCTPKCIVRVTIDHRLQELDTQTFEIRRQNPWEFHLMKLQSGKLPYACSPFSVGNLLDLEGWIVQKRTLWDVNFINVWPVDKITTYIYTTFIPKFKAYIIFIKSNYVKWPSIYQKSLPCKIQD
jgi:hypothetical protein